MLLCPPRKISATSTYKYLLVTMEPAASGNLLAGILILKNKSSKTGCFVLS